MMRATPWAKRLQLLHRVTGLIEFYKSQKKHYLQQPIDQRVASVEKEYRTGNNLLNFLPNAMFYG